MSLGLTVAAANHTLFFLSGKLFFKPQPGKLSRRHFLVFATSYLAIAGASLGNLAKQPPVHHLARRAGVLTSLASTVLFIAAVWATRKSPLTPIHSDDAPKHILREGPYKYIRHPFYTSYLINFSGTALMANGATGWACVAAALWIYVRAARAEERKFARSTLAAEYAAYAETTAVIIPGIL